MQVVELHQAFLWACETCGRDNFARSVVLDPAQAEEIAGRPGNASMAEAMQAMRDANDQFEAVGGHWCTAPDRVTCEHCGTTFATEES